MAVELRPVCICDVCGHEWRNKAGENLPKQCPACRTNKWNGNKRLRSESQRQERRDYISDNW